VTAQAELAETPISLPPTQRITLPNGLTLVIAERKGLPLVAARLELAVGSAHEPAAKSGLAELTVQLLRRGTRKFTAEALDAAVEQVGGQLGVGVDVDSTALSVSLPSEHLPVALEVLAELCQRPRFLGKELAMAKRRVLAGLANQLDDPSAVADVAANLYSLPNHPYGRPGSGFSRTVRTLSRADVQGFWARAFAPEAASIFVVGDLGGCDVARLVKRHFGAWARRAPAFPALPAVPPPQGQRVIVVDKPDATQTQLRLVGAGIARKDPASFACLLAASVLGGGFTSRLMEEIRVNRGLSYGVSARFASFRQGGLFEISTFTKNETAALTVDVARQVTAALAQEGPRAQELADTQTYVRGLYPLKLETNEQIARTLADLHLYDLPLDHVSRFRERVGAVTPSEVRAAARAHFPVERFSLVCVGPAKHLKKALAPLGVPVQVKALSALA